MSDPTISEEYDHLNEQVVWLIYQLDPVNVLIRSYTYAYEGEDIWRAIRDELIGRFGTTNFSQNYHRALTEELKRLTSESHLKQA